MSSTWSDLNVGSITGFGGAQADQGSGGVGSGVETAAATRSGPTPPLYSPQNPLFWFGGLLAVVGGLVGFSGWVDLGPLKGKVKA